MSRMITVGVFVLFGLIGLALWVWARRSPETIARFGTLLDRVLITRSVRITLVVFWFWLGWHFFIAP